MKNKLKRKLRIRFVLLAMTALIIMQGGIVFLSARSNYIDMAKKADLIISQLHIKQETGVAYFSVAVHPGKSVIRMDKSQNVTISQEDVARLVKIVLNEGEACGFVEGYRYQVHRNEDGMRVLFLSRTASFEMYKDAVKALIYNSVIGLGIMCIFLVLASGWIVEPLIRNHKKQKEFITSASHELKTPLTVIMADAQILQMEIGENSWLEDIQEQIRYLTRMTESLVTLAKADEVPEKRVHTLFSVSELIEEILDSYEALSRKSNKKLVYDIGKDIMYSGEESAVHQLVAILLDNAFKYCPEGGEIKCVVQEKKQGVRMVVTNSAEGVSKEQISSFADRFFRGENASEVKGYGLGLSIAHAIVKNHKGTLEISMPEEEKVQVLVMLR